MNNDPVNNNEESMVVTDTLVDQPSEEASPVFGIDFFKKKPLTNSPITDIPLGTVYSISPGDKIRISLVGNKNANYLIDVSLNGSIFIPELGQLYLQGLKLVEANKKLNEIVKNAYVGTEGFLSVNQPSLRKISVVGAVKILGLL